MDAFLITLLIFLFIYLYSTTRKRKIFYDPLVEDIKKDMMELDPRISNRQFYSSDESYTEDKERIYLCLKDERGEYYDYNMLIYVAIHECSHALTDVIDVEHKTPEFKNMFESLLNKASEKGIYDKSIPLVDKYCGIDLDIKDMQR